MKDVAGQFLLVPEKDQEVREPSYIEASWERLAMVLMDSPQPSNRNQD